MNAWLTVWLAVVAFVIGIGVGVHLIGGWRDLRRDLLKIDQEYLAVRQELRAIDEADRADGAV